METKKLIIEKLKDPTTEEKIIKALNEDINIPIIGEKTEKKILTAIYSTIRETLVKLFS